MKKYFRRMLTVITVFTGLQMTIYLFSGHYQSTTVGTFTIRMTNTYYRSNVAANYSKVEGQVCTHFTHKSCFLGEKYCLQEPGADFDVAIVCNSTVILCKQTLWMDLLLQYMPQMIIIMNKLSCRLGSMLLLYENKAEHKKHFK